MTTLTEPIEPPPATPRRTRNATSDPCGDRDDKTGWICDQDSAHTGAHMMGQRREGKIW